MSHFISVAVSYRHILRQFLFEDTWIECLGDLGRYRMEIKDDEPKGREIWGRVAHFWYSKATDKNTTVRRLYPPSHNPHQIVQVEAALVS